MTFLSRLSLPLLLLFCFSIHTASALPEDPGTLSVSKSTQSATLVGASVSFDLYLPTVTSPAPIVVVGHGFQRTKDNMAGWGQGLAARGYIVAIPNFPGGFSPDHNKNGQIVSALLSFLVSENTRAGSVLQGKVDPTRRAAIGHSAGGLAALLATASDPEIDLLIGLDLVDANNLGVAAAANVSVPTLLLRSEPSTCNSNGNSLPVFQAITAPKLTLKVVQGNHCDPESPSDSFCSLFCGGDADATRHGSYERYTYALIDFLFLCNQGFAGFLGGTDLLADTAVTDVQNTGFPPALPATCTSNTPENCANGQDDDGDGAADCADSDCANNPSCSAGNGEICGNGQDDDGDSLADCADSDCATSASCNQGGGGGNEDCFNGQDDDGDSLADCADSDCASASACGNNEDLAGGCSVGAQASWISLLLLSLFAFLFLQRRKHRRQ